MPQAIDEEMLKKRKLPFGLALGGGSVAEEQPQLHLHCKQMILPDISEATLRLQSSDADISDSSALLLHCPYAVELGDFEVIRQVILYFYLLVLSGCCAVTVDFALR